MQHESPPCDFIFTKPCAQLASYKKCTFLGTYKYVVKLPLQENKEEKSYFMLVEYSF